MYHKISTSLRNNFSSMQHMCLKADDLKVSPGKRRAGFVITFKPTLIYFSPVTQLTFSLSSFGYLYPKLGFHRKRTTDVVWVSEVEFNMPTGQLSCRFVLTDVKIGCLSLLLYS